MIEKGVFPGALNMAVDSLMAEWAVKMNAVLFRFYGWERPTVSLGRFQKKGGINVPDWIDVVRRPSGGRALLHHREITYCLAVPRKVDAGKLSVLEFHRLVHSLIRDALVKAGVPAELSSERRGNTMLCFDAPSRYEIVLNGVKVVGSAQFRTAESIVEHGSIVLKQDVELLKTIFGDGIPPLKGILDLYDVDVKTLEESILAQFEKVFGPSKKIQLDSSMLKESRERSSLFEVRRR
ncbi:biotin/lipoate A/B protein ligase [Thermotoga sp. Mc24]|uniref:lipoate--protein ligase family protein n=1 Tax=Thermotoga sp. Mc24 TaxID=1231241 RepID=UPI000541FB81|nr:biotin/lipoate A/B protein ligase family protein [Thermotoga sp. Mc24]KHC90278.1 biotin/lipoate A/B protein ligase [Thermotoga sp. Mc24]